MERRIVLKFLVKLRKSLIECLKRLAAVLGKNVVARTQIFEWHKSFQNVREKGEDDFKSGRHSTSKPDNIIARVKQLVWNDQRLTVPMIGEELCLNRESEVGKSYCIPCELWCDKSHLFHYDSTPAQNAISSWLNKKSQLFTTLRISQELAPCDFWLFPKPKSVMREHIFHLDIK